MKKEKFLDNHLYCRGISLFFVLYSYHYSMAMVRPAITMLTIDISLMRMLSDGMIISHWALRVLLSSERPFLLVFSSYLMCCMFCSLNIIL